ncbi:FtsX-like permease family protein [Actinomadura atramentaria]|uniref:FtsX-like permease family protein n=1 Tax=Actinomadura atramentaria TaxID=1990 RepID=UPI000360AEAF|nr:FtsX-like permease family protein [Actinomadura atramentaria]
MLTLALNSLRFRKGSFAGAYAVLLAAAALVCACGTLMVTGLLGHVGPERYAGAPVVVAGDPQSHFVKGNGKHKSKPNTARALVPPDVAARVAALPGVRTVTEITVPAVLQGVRASGHNWAFAALASGRAPRDGEIVVESGRARAGDRLTLLTPSGARAFTVSGTTESTTEPTFYLSPADAARLAPRPGFTAIGVWPASAAPAVERALRGTGAVAATGDDRGRLEFPASGAARTKLVSMGAALGGTSLFVAVLAVVGTLGVAARQREREFAVLRAVAATPRQLRALVGREALVLGFAAAAPGAAAGLLLGRVLHRVFVHYGAIPANQPMVTAPYAPLAAVALTVVAAFAAARISARRITRLRPVEALGEAALAPPRTPWLRLLAGVVALAGAVTLTLVLSTIHSEAGSGPVTPLAALLGATAVALLGPLLARAVLGPLAAPLERAPGAVGLAAAQVRSGPRRVAAVMAPLTLMTALAATLLFAQTTLAGAAADQARDGVTADYVVGPAVPASGAAALRRVPGVTAVTEVLHTRVRAVSGPYSVQGVTPDGLAATADLGVTSGSLADLGAGTVAAREGIGKRVGDTLSVSMADGTPVKLRVVAVYRRGLGFGDLTMPHQIVAAHVDNPLGTVLVAAPGVPRAALARAVADLPGVGVLDRAAAPGPADGGTAVNCLALGMIIGFAAISLVNTLAMDVLTRVRELALLRLAGATRRQVLRALRLETLAALAAGTVLGGGIAAAALTAYAAGMTGSAAPHVPASGVAALVAATTALALLATALPARAALRAAPVQALAARE